jgi:hypothetical protein
MTSPFVLSIEPTDGPTFLHGFHLGTDERVARQIAEGRFHGRNLSGCPTRSVALLRDNVVFDVYDGEWASQRLFD